MATNTFRMVPIACWNMHWSMTLQAATKEPSFCLTCGKWISLLHQNIPWSTKVVLSAKLGNTEKAHIEFLPFITSYHKNIRTGRCEARDHMLRNRKLQEEAQKITSKPVRRGSFPWPVLVGSVIAASFTGETTPSKYTPSIFFSTMQIVSLFYHDSRHQLKIDVLLP